MKIEKVRVNLEANRVQLFGEKNFLVVKREELRAEIITLNAAGFSNVPIRRYQNPLLRPTRDKLKVKRPVSFDNIKKNFQRFFTKTRYYQRFYQQNLPFDSNKIQDIIVNIIKDVSKQEEPLFQDFLEYDSDNQKEFIQYIFEQYKDFETKLYTIFEISNEKRIIKRKLAKLR